MKKVVILTTFRECDDAYSLNVVVRDQIKMLRNAGHQVTVLVAEGFVPKHEYAMNGVTVNHLPDVPVSNQVQVDETFDQDVERLRDALLATFSDDEPDFIFTHDIVYQPAAFKHNVAARLVAKERENIKWLHWIHSATSPFTLINERQFFQDDYKKMVSVPFPNSYYVFFNEYSRPRISANFGVEKDKILIVPHPVDVADYFGFHPVTRVMVKEWDLLNTDVMATYPVRLDRGKQVQHVVRTMAEMRSVGLDHRLVVVDFHSTGGDKVNYRMELAQEAKRLGCKLFFTSGFSEETQYSVPRQVVRDLMLISDVYIHPSVSESYSLAVQEACLTGSVVVLNDDFPPMRDIYGNAPIFRKYSSQIDSETGLDGETVTEYNDEPRYHFETALEIAKRLKGESAIQLKRNIIRDRDIDAVYNKYLRGIIEQ